MFISLASSSPIAAIVGLSLVVATGDPGGLHLRSRVDAAAEPAAGAGSSEAGEASAPAAAESHDLDAALEAARAAREASPSAARWLAEAEVLERRGELVAARDAYTAALEAEGAGALDRSSVEAKIEALEEQSRGRVADEPESTHREALDAARALREAPPPKPAAAPVEAPPPAIDDRVVTKWYFWVTVVAIVASAGAITGIAIKAASDDRKARDASQDRGAQLPGSPALLRF